MPVRPGDVRRRLEDDPPARKQKAGSAWQRTMQTASLLARKGENAAADDGAM